MANDIQFHHADDWTAVYLNGQLVRVGDTYLAEEWLHREVGVVDVFDDAFMRGQNSRDGVAQTLDEVASFATERDVKIARATALREEASRLLSEAGVIEKDVSSRA